jgi:regulator of sigma E protease
VSYVLAFLGFSFLILAHEAGHFVAAKAVGMRVERFSLFFGPLLVKVRRGETEYGIAPIPLGGYVKITGMNPNEEMPDEVRPRAYYNQKVWKRVVVILAGPAVNLLIAFVIMAAIFSAQGRVATRNGQPLPGKIAAGTLEQPAASYLKAGDQIVSVDGRRDLNANQLTQQINSHRCAGGATTPGCHATTPVTMTVLRNGKLRTFSIVPRYDATVKRMRLGFAYDPLLAPVGLFGAADQSLSQMWYVTHTTITTLARLFEPKERAQLHGVVGGFTVTQERFAYDTTDALYTLALISLSLAVVNLFPFLPLDGGHVFWAVAEKLRGRKIPFETMERASVLGFVLIVLVFVIGLSNDISTLTGQGFNAR